MYGGSGLLIFGQENSHHWRNNPSDDRDDIMYHVVNMGMVMNWVIAVPDTVDGDEKEV